MFGGLTFLLKGHMILGSRVSGGAQRVGSGAIGSRAAPPQQATAGCWVITLGARGQRSPQRTDAAWFGGTGAPFEGVPSSLALACANSCSEIAPWSRRVASLAISSAALG